LWIGMAYDYGECSFRGKDFVLRLILMKRTREGKDVERGRSTNMVTNRWRKTGSRPNESGQALMFLVLALGLVFLGAGALSVDMSNLWFHRQAAQNAADAACTAG